MEPTKTYSFALVGSFSFTIEYRVSDTFWSLPKEKQERQAIADMQKRLTVRADELVKISTQVRG